MIRPAKPEDMSAVVKLNAILAEKFEVPTYFMKPEILKKLAFNKNTELHRKLNLNEIIANIFVAVSKKTGEVVGKTIAVPQIQDGKRLAYRVH